MDIEEHGGGCCGVRHIYGMDGGTEAELRALIEELDNEPRQGNRLIEIILSDRQVGVGDRMQNRNPAEGWPAILARNGFRLVSRFRNSNSGNNCFVFHRVPNFASIRPADLPFEWNHASFTREQMQAGGPGVLHPVAPAAPVVVATFYANVLRTGRGAKFDTREAANAAAPRARSIDRLEILSDGTQRWTEGV